MEHPQPECRAERVQISSITPSWLQVAALLGYIHVLRCISARTYICQYVPFQPAFLGGTGQTLASDPFLRGSRCASACLLCRLLSLSAPEKAFT